VWEVIGSGEVLVGTGDHLEGIGAETAMQGIEFAADGSSQQLHMVGRDLIVVLGGMLQLAQASAAEASGGTVEPAENGIGEVSEPQRLPSHLWGQGRGIGRGGGLEGTIVG
jgi:hypothetical protein